MISARLSDGTARKLMTGHPKCVIPQNVCIEVSTQALPRGDLSSSPRAKSSLGITYPMFRDGPEQSRMLGVSSPVGSGCQCVVGRVRNTRRNLPI